MLLRLSTILGSSGNRPWFEIYLNYKSIVKISDLWTSVPKFEKYIYFGILTASLSRP